MTTKPLPPAESLAVVPCYWSEETPDACPYCSGESCAQCVGVGECNHDSFERHLIAQPAETPAKSKGFNEFLGAVQKNLLALGLDAPGWIDNSIRDQDDYDAALESCTKTMAKLLTELAAQPAVADAMPEPFLTALRAYQQADADGVMVTVSRQAIHETLDHVASLRQEVEKLREEVLDHKRLASHWSERAANQRQRAEQAERRAEALREDAEAAIQEMETALKAASEERYQRLEEWRREAEKWKSEGDMDGWK